MMVWFFPKQKVSWGKEFAAKVHDRVLPKLE